MSKPKPIWFLPQGRDSPPTDALALGNIISNPSEPEETINVDPAPAVPASHLRTLDEAPWSWTREFSHSPGGGIFASFLQSIVGIGGEFEASSTTEWKQNYEAQRLLTQYFVPDREYIAASLRDADVADALTKRRKVYMITGIKIAFGATKSWEALKKKDLHALVGVDATALGWPVSAGAKGNFEKKMTDRTTVGKSDFVFGYQLRELRVKRDGEAVHKKYVKGALWGNEDDGAENKEIDEELDPENFAAEDVKAAEFNMQSHEVFDDGTEMIVMIA